MAGNENSGRDPIFPLSEKELKEKFDQYKADLEEGKFARASMPHFIAYIGCLEDEVKEFIEKYSGEPRSAYYRRARIMRQVVQWMRGQVFSSKDWTGQQARLAGAHLERNYGDGVTYNAKDGSGPQEVLVSFGGNDPRAKEAAK